MPERHSILVSFHITVIKYPDGSNLREKGLVLAHRPLLAGKSQQQELVTTDHITSTVKKQGEMKAGAQLASSFHIAHGVVPHTVSKSAHLC